MVLILIGLPLFLLGIVFSALTMKAERSYGWLVNFEMLFGLIAAFGLLVGGILMIVGFLN